MSVATTVAPAGVTHRPGRPHRLAAVAETQPTGQIDPVWVERGVESAARVVDLVLRVDPDLLVPTGASVAKVIAETAILARALRPHHRAAGLRRLVDRLAGLARDHRTLTALAMHASASFELAVPYLVLREQACSDAVDRLLTTAFTASAARGRELLPHRRLERQWLAGMLPGAPGITADDITGTVVGDELDLLHGTRDDHYAFTHALFYATDFGRRPDRVPARLLPGLIEQARSALAGALDDDDYDLAGELLLTWPLLRVPAGPVEAAALRVLTEVAGAVGTLPSLTLAAPLPEVPGLTVDEVALLSTYHTGFVFTVLAALAPLVPWQTPGQAGHALRDSWPAGRRDESSVPRRPAWLDLPAAELNGGALPLEARLRRAARAGQASDIADALCRPGVPSTPATRQALQLLQRLSLL